MVFWLKIHGTCLELELHMNMVSVKNSPLIKRMSSKLFSCRTILRFLVCLTIVNSTACGPTSVNHYHGNDKILTNSTNQDKEKGGTGDGGGGQGILCTNEVKDERIKNQLHVRDIFEAIINHRRTMKFLSSIEDSDKVDPKAIQLLVNSIKGYFGPATYNLEFGNEKFWTDFAEKISFLKEDTPLFPSNDANSPIGLPVGCQIVQIAYWDESAGASAEGTLYVDHKRWRQLSQFNKVALLAHEYFFKQARKAGYKNSDFIRYKVGQLLSKDGLEPVFKEWEPAKDPRMKDLLPASKKGFKFCQGTSSDDPTAQLQFYQYEGKDKFQHFVFPFIKSNSINLSLFQAKEFVVDTTHKISAATDLLIYASDFAGKTEDLFVKDHDEQLTLWYKGSGLLFGNVIFYPKSTVYAVRAAMEWLKSLKNKTVWADQVSSANRTIRLSLLNPLNSDLAGDNAKTQMKSQAALVAVINKKIEGELLSAKYSNEQIYNAIAMLNWEIDQSIKTGKYQKEFPKWTAELKKISQNSSLNYLEDRIVFVDLPLLLYRVKLNNYDEKEIFKGIGNEGFEQFSVDDLESWIKGPILVTHNTNVSHRDLEKGRILVQQGNESLEFNLSCKDYTAIYLANTNNDPISSEGFHKKDNIQFDMSSFSSNDTVEEDLPFLEQIKKFLIFIASKDLNSEEHHQFWNTEKYNCELFYGVNGLNCRDLKMLNADLKIESKITAMPCEKYYGAKRDFNRKFYDEDSGEEISKACVLIKLNSAQKNYIISFSNSSVKKKIDGVNYGNSQDLPFLTFIRQVVF